jgi:N-acetylglucosamine-6-phosphate deacetylase
VIKKGPLATLEDGTLAGSVTNLFDCMRKAISFGIRPEDAIRAATANPAASIGLYPDIGSLAPGAKANVLILDRESILYRGLSLLMYLLPKVWLHIRQ